MGQRDDSDEKQQFSSTDPCQAKRTKSTRGVGLLSEWSRQCKTATKPLGFGSQNRRTWTYCIILFAFTYITLITYL